MAKMKKECMYCIEDPDGDLPERKDLLVWRLGMIGDTVITAFVNIEESFDGATNSLTIGTNQSDRSKKVQINYCPMCGRRLKI